MRVIAVIVARMGSTRFQGKVMIPISGRPMLEWMIDRVRRSNTVQGIVIATTNNQEDDCLVELARRLHVDCFRGPSEDVLERVYGAVRWTQPDLVVELLGDNPLVDATLVDDVVSFHRLGKFDYSATVTSEYPHAASSLRKFPIGIRVQVFSPEALARCASEAKDPSEREHSTSFMYYHPELFRLGYFEATGVWSNLNRPELTFAVNYPENLEMIRQVTRLCAATDPAFSLSQVIAVFDSDSTLVSLMGEASHPQATQKVHP